MKRGRLVLLLLLGILLIPFVSAATDDVLDILMGSSESSMVFLRFMYGALIFIIFLSVVKKTIFKATDTNDKQSKKLGNIFSLIIAIFATRFTPESVVQNFGWVIMFLTPLLIYYTIFGIFTRAKVQKADDKELNFSWIRFILALIATLFTLSALGKNNYLGNFPFIGGGLNELFFDLNYYLFDKWLTFLLILILLGIILALLSKFGGFGTKKDANGKEIPSLIPGWIILAILIILLLVLLLTLFGGVGIPFNLGWLWYVLGIAIILLLLFLLIRFFPQLRGLLGGLRNLFRRNSKPPGTPATPVPSDRIRIDLKARGRSVSSININKALLAEPNTDLPISVIVSVRKRFWWNQPIKNANLTFSVTNGSITGNIITDTSGKANIIFKSPNEVTSFLTISVAPTPISSAYVSPRFPIQVKSNNRLLVNVSPLQIIVDVGNPAVINVNVSDKKGNPVPNATVNVFFKKASLPSIAGTTNASGLASITTPNLSTIASHYFTAVVTHPKYPNPANGFGTITVRNPIKPDLNVQIITPTPATVPVGNSINIEFAVTEKGATPIIPINTAKFNVKPRVGTSASSILGRLFSPVKRNSSFNGRYTLTINPDRTQAGSTITFSINVSNNGYNDTNFDFDIIVPALPQLTITPTFPNNIFQLNPANLQVTVTDSVGTNVNATINATSSVGGSVPGNVIFTRNPSGVYTSVFTPSIPGNYTFNLIASHPRFADSTLIATLNVLPLPPLSLSCVLIWAPNPSNYYQLMQIRVLNSNTGKPVSGAKVLILDSYRYSLRISGTLTTDATGSFPSQIRLQPATTISTNEIHNINITVSASGFPIASTSIQMTFEPPGSPLGGVSRRFF